MRTRRPVTTIAASLCFFLTGVAVSGQTLTVVRPTNHVQSPRLSDIHDGTAPAFGPTEVPHHPLPLQANSEHKGGSAGTQPDAALQTSLGPLINATAGVHFDGINESQTGYIPSDNNIAVGPNHIVETVNAAYAVYGKTGALLLGPYQLRSLWKTLGGQCAANNSGDPVVQYDRLADRWIITQLGSLSSPYAECIAVSTTGDPTGTYNLYSYPFGTALNDYPKFGVWPTATNSAYLATYNLFYGGSGAEICAYDRAAMLAGAASPVSLCYTGITGWSYLPVDLDGATPPLDGTPPYFVDLYSTGGSLGVYKLTPNFATATATLSSFSTIPVASFSQASSVPQPGTTTLLDSLSDRLMNRLAFRMYGDHESMVVNHSVSTGGVAGVRWYELRAPVSTSGSFSLYQQGTVAPADGNHRWMGSAAMDQAGNIALGYNASNGTSLYPSVRYTGRTPADGLGTMESEASIKEGSGSQTGYSRWGDYSSMRIDPSDDCTFWFVNEYLPATSSYVWYTHIGSFKFNGCGGPAVPDFSLSASPSSLTLTQGQTGNSTVTVTSISGFTDPVSLSVSGCPGTATCSVSPSPVTPTGTSTLTVITTASTVAGTYILTITGTGSSGTHSTTVALTVNPPPADFTLSLSASTLAVKRRSSNSLTVSLGALGGSSSVTLSTSGLPSKVTSSFTPNPVTATGSSTLKISANPQAAVGSYTVTVTGTNGTSSHFKTFTLTVN